MPVSGVEVTQAIMQDDFTAIGRVFADPHLGIMVEIQSEGDSIVIPQSLFFDLTGELSGVVQGFIERNDEVM